MGLKCGDTPEEIAYLNLFVVNCLLLLGRYEAMNLAKYTTKLVPTCSIVMWAAGQAGVPPLGGPLGLRAGSLTRNSPVVNDPGSLSQVFPPSDPRPGHSK